MFCPAGRTSGARGRDGSEHREDERLSLSLSHCTLTMSCVCACLSICPSIYVSLYPPTSLYVVYASDKQCIHIIVCIVCTLYLQIYFP